MRPIDRRSHRIVGRSVRDQHGSWRRKIGSHVVDRAIADHKVANLPVRGAYLNRLARSHVEAASYMAAAGERRRPPDQRESLVDSGNFVGGIFPCPSEAMSSQRVIAPTSELAKSEPAVNERDLTLFVVVDVQSKV